MPINKVKVTEEEVREELQRVRELYKSNAKLNNSFNVLVYGEKGTGKTRLAKTCRRPILLHSFDPGGTKTLRDEIDEGWITADTRYENEDGKRPSAFRLWSNEFDKLRKSGFFNHIGTFFLDSVTTWADAILNLVQQQKGSLGSQPTLPDYMVQQMTMKDILKIFTMLPCDCVLTGHIGYDKDEMTGKIFSSLLLGPKAAVKMPILFDEMYVSIAKGKANKVDYSILTSNNGIYKATTRLGKEGIFDTYEKPDIKYLMRKAGLDVSDI